MFCYKCGGEMPDDSDFCPKCGSRTHRELLDSEYEEFEEEESEGNEFDNSPLNEAAPSISTAPAAVKTVKKRRCSEPVTNGLSRLARLFAKIGTTPLVLVAIYATLSAIFKLPLPIIVVFIAFVLAIIGYIMSGFTSILDKSKALAYLFLTAAVTALIAGIVFFNSRLNDKISSDAYISTIKELSPFTDMDYTCGEVFGKYIKSSEWESSDNDDGSHTVRISGKVNGTDKPISIHFKMVVDGEYFDLFIEELTYSGTKFTADDATEFLYSMFTVYGEGYNSLEEGSQLSELTSSAPPDNSVQITSSEPSNSSIQSESSELPDNSAQSESSGGNTSDLKLGAVGKTYIADNGYYSHLYLDLDGEFKITINMMQGYLDVSGNYYEIPGGYKCVPFDPNMFGTFEMKIDGNSLVYTGESVGGTWTGDVYNKVVEIDDLSAYGNPLTERLKYYYPPISFDADAVLLDGMPLNISQHELEKRFGEPLDVIDIEYVVYSFSFLVSEDYLLKFYASDEYSPAHTICLYSK